MFELEIKDNGVGLSAARLTDFNRGIGLGNTRSRLQHLYGCRTASSSAATAAGISVLIAIPLVEITEAGEDVRTLRPGGLMSPAEATPLVARASARALAGTDHLQIEGFL